MTDLNAAIRGIPIPLTMQGLPVDDRGFLVPWFVPRGEDGTWDFRQLDGKKLVRAIKQKRCWLCGEKLGRLYVNVIGPMCAISRTTAEPACHPACARYAVMACPFLTNPRMRRNLKNKPEDAYTPGVAIPRNPGVMVLWASLRPPKPFNDGQGGLLLEVQRPERIEWWSQGRLASRDECQESISSGLPILREAAANDPDPDGAIAELGVRTLYAISTLPAPVAPDRRPR